MLRSTGVRTAVADLAKNGERFNPLEYWERCDGIRRAERPHWMEAGEPCCKARLNAFSDEQSECYVLIGVELDRSTACATEHLAAELTTGAVEKRPVNPARLIRHDVTEESYHATDTRTFVIKRRMKPDHVSGDVTGELETALGYEILPD